MKTRKQVLLVMGLVILFAVGCGGNIDMVSWRGAITQKAFYEALQAKDWKAAKQFLPKKKRDLVTKWKKQTKKYGKLKSFEIGGLNGTIHNNATTMRMGVSAVFAKQKSEEQLTLIQMDSEKATKETPIKIHDWQF